MDKTKSCDTCCYFFLDEKYGSSYAHIDPWEEKMRWMGRCRRRSPFHNGWPITWGSYYCGDWKKGARKKVLPKVSSPDKC